MIKEVYISTDIEANGRSPGHHSMLSFASVAFKLDKTIVSTFERNLKELSGTKPIVKQWNGGKLSQRLGKPAGKIKLIPKKL